MKGITFIYFSATETTARCARAVGNGLGLPINREINIADNHTTELPYFQNDDVAIIAAPVYAGRLPQKAVETIRILRSKGAFAIGLVVYGNRDYDDALLELTDMLKKSRFNIIGAGAFIGQHSIFPNVANKRPDKSDITLLQQFGAECRARLDAGLPFEEIEVNGTFPYRQPSPVPLHPKCDYTRCRRCGECVRKCPVGAIPSGDPTITIEDKCISCGRCIHVCSNYARRYTGIKYKLVAKVFEAKVREHKEPIWTIAK